MDQPKTRTSGGNTLSSRRTAPLKPKSGLSGPPVHPSRRLGVIRSILLGRSFRNKSSKDMAFPHPESRKHHYRKEDIPSWGSIVWKLFKRTINVTEYRNGKDDVNPAKNRTLGGSIHGQPPRAWSVHYFAGDCLAIIVYKFRPLASNGTP
jgi:hypothetical protein